MLISYEPLSDVLSVIFEGAPVASTQLQGTVSVSFDNSGHPVSVAIPDASTLLWEKGGQVNVMLPETQTVTVTRTVL